MGGSQLMHFATGEDQLDVRQRQSLARLLARRCIALGQLSRYAVSRSLYPDVLSTDRMQAYHAFEQLMNLRTRRYTPAKADLRAAQSLYTAMGMQDKANALECDLRKITAGT